MSLLGAALAALFFIAILAVRLFRPLLAWWVPRRLGPYEVIVADVDPSRPERLEVPRRVAVIGAGLAGIASASALAARGFHVVLFEKNAWIGGKIGAFPIEWPGRAPVPTSHGFHAFFRHYYNLNRFLDELGLRREFAAISDYTILEQNGAEIRFGGLAATPVLNLLDLAKRGVFRYRDVLFGPAKDLMGVFLEYRGPETFDAFDRLSFAEFATRARLPPRLKLAFNTFSRAFFADEDRLSLAELIKCFHFYFLGHDGGLVYDFPVRDYEPALLAPIREHLSALGVELRLSTPVESLAKLDDGFEVNGARFDAVVLAADAAASRKIVLAAKGLDASALRASFEPLRSGQRYAVLRLWLDRDVRAGLPVFVITDRLMLLDAVALYHRLELEAAQQVSSPTGSVLELHSYAVPDQLPTASIRDQFVREMEHFFPELEGANIEHEHLQVRDDFTAFHVGQNATRPSTQSGVPGLHFAGDWVKLEFPAMLMEGAFASGLVAANQVLAEHGLSGVRVSSVPLEGVMAGFPAPPARSRLLSTER